MFVQVLCRSGISRTVLTHNAIKSRSFSMPGMRGIADTKLQTLTRYRLFSRCPPHRCSASNGAVHVYKPDFRQYSTRVSDEFMPDKKVPIVSPANSGKHLLVRWDNGEESKLLSQWLRFNCQCPECVSPSTNQRTLYADKLLPWPRICSATIKDDVVHIEWKDTNESHTGCFEVEWLRDNCYQTAMKMSTRMSRNKPTSPKSVPTIAYQEIVDSDHGLWRWLQILNEHGICVIKGAPTSLGEVAKIAEMISYVQETIFGKIWDVIALESDEEDVAYGTSRLALHQDEIYYDATPGISFLHCIRNDECVVGGENIMIDAFPVIEEFRVKHRQHFDTLTTIPGTFQRIWKKHGEVVEYVKRQKHHIAVDRFGQIIGISWSQHNGGPIYEEEEDTEAYFEAYIELWKAFETSPLKLYNRPENGDVLTLNNKRFLHSRTEFTLNGGVRHLQGTYVTIDGFKSKYHVLSKQLGKKVPMKQMFDYCTL